MRTPLYRHIDPKIPEISYFIGFITGDGNISFGTQNRAKLSIEISYRDRDILYKLVPLLDGASVSERERTILLNGKEYNERFSKLTISRVETCKRLVEIGIPSGKKSELASIPKEDYCERDFWRGVIDADGSLGLTKEGIPFISLVTKSELLANSYKDLIFRLTNHICETKRNKRDNIYNIMIIKEKAQILVNYLYYENCLCLLRKKEKANLVISWARPENMRIQQQGFKWTSEADIIIKTHKVKEAMKILNLGRNAIASRKQRLK